jgi:hypothetical protein
MKFNPGDLVRCNCDNCDGLIVRVAYQSNEDSYVCHNIDTNADAGRFSEEELMPAKLDELEKIVYGVKDGD